MKYCVFFAVFLVTVLAALPARAQSPQMNSQFIGNNVTNSLTAPGTPQTNQLTGTSIVTSWIAGIGRGIGGVFTGQGPIRRLFSTSGPTTQYSQPTYQMPPGPYATPVPSQMSAAQFQAAFNWYYLTPPK
jgi:hypothetical protein